MLSFKNKPSPSKALRHAKTLYIKRTKTISSIDRSKLFDADYYSWRYRLFFREHKDALAHYLLTGWKKYYDPHPLFNTPLYILQVGALRQPALLHYLRVGFHEKISPHPLFDADHYYHQRPDVWDGHVEPIRHYLEYGAADNINPSPFFSEKYYKAAYPYVAQSGMNSLVHFVIHGEREGLNPSDTFTTRAYLAANPDVASSELGALEHYVVHGRKEGRLLRPRRNTRIGPTAPASLSVVIPTHNRSALLRETLELCQRHSETLDVEYIVIDDGSQDDTAIVLAEMAKRYSNIVHRSVENGGPGRARNIGASLATKEVILFLGDDIQPSNSDFFETHANLHRAYPSNRFAVLGKCVWPDNTKLKINHVMRHIQGRGGEQFGYADFVPYSFIDWRFFYTSNVSVKRDVVGDWLIDGFSQRFTLYGFEDTELAYRLSREAGGFKIFYDPGSTGRHIHPYSVDEFLNRQFSTGLMADTFIKLHEVTGDLGLEVIVDHLRAPQKADDAAVVADCLAILEGIKAWTRLLDRNDVLGHEAWHDDLLHAIFEAAYYQGFISAQTRSDANVARAYQFVLGNFVRRMRRTIHHELCPSEFIYSGLFGPLVEGVERTGAS